MLSLTNCTLTHFVKQFSLGSQFQRVQCIRLAQGGLLFKMEFFPNPKYLLFFSSDQGIAWSIDKKTLHDASSQNLPLVLFLKAHFVNHRISYLEQSSGNQFRLEFDKDRTLLLNFNLHSLDVECEVPAQKKSYKVSLKLAALPSSDCPSEPQGVSPNTQISKAKRLRQNIEADLHKASTELQSWSAVEKVLKKSPEAIKLKSQWARNERDLIEGFYVKYGFSPWSNSNTRIILTKIFSHLQRLKRRVEGGQRRLREIENSDLKSVISKNSSPHIVKRKGTTVKSSLGLSIDLEEGIKVLIGRSAKENDELLRLANSNDLWFHVRGEQGAHVWLPRRQKNWKGKDMPPEKYIEKAGQLALMNSRRRSSGSGYVDIATKKDLKKIKGSLGAVTILRSEVRFFRIDAEFERLVFRKK